MIQTDSAPQVFAFLLQEFISLFPEQSLTKFLLTQNVTRVLPASDFILTFPNLPKTLSSLAIIPDQIFSQLTDPSKPSIWEAKTLLNQEKELIEQVDHICGNLNTKTYTDEDLLAFLTQVQETPFLKLDAFFETLLQQKQISLQQLETIRNQFDHLFENPIPLPISYNLLDINLWIQTLETPLESLGFLIICLPKHFMPYEHGIFLEKVLLNPQFQVKQIQSPQGWKWLLIQKVY